jgi:hypothetical protein
MPEIVEHICLVIGVIGATVIFWGVLLGVLRLMRLKWASLSGRDTLVEGEDLRHNPELHPGDRRHLHRKLVPTRRRCEAGGSVFLQRGADDRPFLP